MRMDKREWITFFTIALIFVLVEAKGLTVVTPGDENVYFYMAKSVTEGKIPYRDFFYAHPPLHIFILAAIIKIFGVNIVALKTATLVFLLTASFFLYKTSVELFKNIIGDKHAFLMSILTLIIFLFSFEIMFKATFSIGINLSLMFLMMSFYFIFEKKYFIGGAFAGLAGLTRFYTLPPIFAISIFLFFKKNQEHRIRDFLFFAGGFTATFGIVVASLLILFGQNFIQPAFSYHFLKPQLSNQKVIVYQSILKEDWVILLAFSLSLFTRNKGKFQLFYLILFIYLLFLLFIGVIAEFYFSIAFPFMAIIGSYSIVEIIRKVKMPQHGKYVLIFSIIIFFLWNTSADVMFLERYGFMKFSPLDQLVAEIESASQSQKLFGDDATVTLVALLTNRSIALNFIDSNEMRFTSGLTNFFIFRYQIEDENISHMIFRKTKGLYQISQFRDYANSRCALEKEYYDIIEGSFLLYKCPK